MSFASFLASLFENPPPPRVARVSIWETEATRAMRRLNPHALIAEENGVAVFIEECWDCDTDRRVYKLEYRSTFDAQHAVAFVLHNPWSNGRDRAAGVSVSRGHAFSDGLLCLSSDHSRSPHQSSMTLDTVVRRARYWCTAFSVLKETGEFPNL